jgi:phosphotransferase family enzyme
MAVMTEEPLSGGNITRGVVRLGGTVRRARSRRSAFAAQVLSQLELVAFPYAPRYLGVDEQGRDILSFIPGRTTDHPSQRAAGAYALGGRVLRALHDATAGHPLADAQECVIHGDPGPYNTIFQDGLPVALIDWDTCRPGRRIDDLGYMAWTWCIQSQGNVPIDEQAEHLHEVSRGYGDVQPEELLESVVHQQTYLADVEAANLEDPRHSPKRRRHAEAAVAWATGDRELVQRHKEFFLSALRSPR